VKNDVIYHTSGSRLVSPAMVMARADYAFTFYIASPHDANEYKYWVTVEKSRTSSSSRHAFLNIDDALAFMKGFKR